MGDRTGISWTEHTLNFWKGCTRVSPGCLNCYAEAMMSRVGFDFDTVTVTKTWGDAARWQRAAAIAGRHEMVFTCSWSDFFHTDADQWRDGAWKVIRDCPNLIFQILTKRPLRIENHLPSDWGNGYPNVWLGVSIESPQYYWRVDALRTIPARIHFLSAEPLLEPLPDLDLTNIQWVIVGGESGNGTKLFRFMPHAWATEIRDKCQASGTAFFFKQSAAFRNELGTKLDGQTYHEYPAL